MEEENKETIESPQGENLEEKSEPGENLEEKSDEQDKEIQTRDAQIAHWRNKAKKLEEENNSLKSKKNSEDEEIWETTNDPMDTIRLGKSLKDYSEEETEFIIQNAPTKDIKGIMDAEKNEMVRLAIQAKREKVAKEKSLAPNTNQPESEKPKTIEERLKEAKTFDEEEKILNESGFRTSLGRNFDIK